MKNAKVKSTKRSLIMSVLSLMLCVAMLLGTTYAWFTDSVTSGKNKIVAGNLDVELTHSNAKVTTPEDVQDSTDLFKFEKVGNSYKEVLWEPGMVVYENFTVSNVGTLALKYALNLNVFDKNAVNGTNQDLTEVIKVAVVDGGFTGNRAAAQAITSFQTLADFQKTGNLAAKNDGDTDESTYGVVLYWQPTDHDNDYNVNNYTGTRPTSDGQPLFVEFGVNLVATQDTVEADSFDELYDATAPLAVMSTPMTKKLAETESLKIVVPEEAESSVKEAYVPAAVANAIFDEVFDDSTDTDKSLTLVLNVEEKSKTDTTFNYEIDMDAVIKEVSGSTVITNETKSVNDLGLTFTDFVEVQMNITPGLLNVNVKHNGNDMKEVADLAAAKAFTPEVAAGYYNYQADGLTKLWIKSFSPFVVTGEKVVVLDTKEAIKEAMDVAKSGDTLTIKAGDYYFGEKLNIPVGVDIASDGSGDVYLIVPVVKIGGVDQNYTEASFTVDKTKTYQYGIVVTSTAYEGKETVHYTSGTVEGKDGCGAVAYWESTSDNAVSNQTSEFISLLSFRHDDCSGNAHNVEFGWTVEEKSFHYTFSGTSN